MIFAALLVASVFQTASDPQTCDPNIRLEAWGSARTVEGEVVPLGRKSLVTLKATDQVRYALPPGRSPTPGSNGAVLRFTVATDGVYSVGLSNAAWVDVIFAGKSVKSIAPPTWAECSAIRKSINFKLAPGDYVLQLSGVTRASMGVLIQPQ